MMTNPLSEQRDDEEYGDISVLFEREMYSSAEHREEGVNIEVYLDRYFGKD